MRHCIVWSDGIILWVYTPFAVESEKQAKRQNKDNASGYDATNGTSAQRRLRIWQSRSTTTDGDTSLSNGRGG